MQHSNIWQENKNTVSNVIELWELQSGSVVTSYLDTKSFDFNSL